MTSWRVCDTLKSTSETAKPDAAISGSLIRRVESIAKPAEPPRWLGRFFSESGKEEQVVIFQRKVAWLRYEVVRAGWNDAAWGRPHRQFESDSAQYYESGYAGGVVFRRKQQADLVQRRVASKPLPRRVPAA